MTRTDPKLTSAFFEKLAAVFNSPQLHAIKVHERIAKTRIPSKKLFNEAASLRTSRLNQTLNLGNTPKVRSHWGSTNRWPSQ